MERLHKQASDRIKESLTFDQRQILELAHQEYSPEEIARELALPSEYVLHFMTGLVQRLTHDAVIPSPEWRNVMRWAEEEEIIAY